MAGDASTGFKLPLGDIRPGQSPNTRATFECSDGAFRSAFQLTSDFLNGILDSVEAKLPGNALRSLDARVIVAEPLQFQVEGRRSDWLNNYRSNIRRILSRFKEIEFLPEPFAVYQYYRYGLRLPKLADRSKHLALILDMGGGTFDACVIESTMQGDISLSGSHSKPLSAGSAPYAGFYLDRRIALRLLKRQVPDSRKGDIDRYYDQYERTIKGTLDRSILKEEAQSFFDNIDKLRPICEDKKIKLSNAISDWSLRAERYNRVEIDVPLDPFSRTSAWIGDELISHQMYVEFEALWNSKLKGVIQGVLKRAKESLKGRKIDVSLISGGSANIGWLKNLIMRDFASELDEAEPVDIGGSFQDVVANGLAIECVRRNSALVGPASEFVAVTYNPIRLLLAPDDDELVANRFGSIGEKIDMEGASAGDLIPSAHSLRHFFDQPLRWRTKLASPPRRYLHYLFCRPFDSQDKDVLDHAYNVQERRLRTTVSKFDSQTIVELTVRRDGTAEPKFVYKQENTRGNVAENSEVGTPFYIDMTTDANDLRRQTQFVGLDFGTSNSSICCLSNSQIELVQERSSSGVWNGISSVLPSAPYPAAAAIRRYLAQHEKHRIFDSALEAYEACLALLAYSLAADTLYGRPQWRGLGTYQHRALGPLKALLYRSALDVASGGVCVRDPRRVGGPLVDEAAQHFTDGKHNKASRESPKWVEYVEEIVQAMVQAFQGRYFGYCISCNKVPMEDRFTGTFVVAHDQRPFVDKYEYTSTKAIDPSVALMFDAAEGVARSLTPLLTWQVDGSGDPVCYILDRIGDCLYKACDAAKTMEADEIHPGLAKAIEELMSNGKFVVGDVRLDVRGLSLASQSNMD